MTSAPTRWGGEGRPDKVANPSGWESHPGRQARRWVGRARWIWVMPKNPVYSTVNSTRMIPWGGKAWGG